MAGAGAAGYGQAAAGAAAAIAGIADLFASGPRKIIKSKYASRLVPPFSDLLFERLTTSPEDTSSFARLSAALRESIGGVAEGARGRLSDAAVGGGWFDSGGRVSALQDIDRSELQAYGQSVRQLLETLEQRRTADLLPFLSLATGENTATEGLRIDKFNADIGAILGGAEAMGGAQMGGMMGG